jgi:hypothetical protein
MVAVSVGWQSSVGTDNITTIVDDKGDNLTWSGDFSQFGTYYWISFYLLSGNITSGARTFTATINASRQFGDMIIDEFSGVAASAALDGHAINNQNTPAATPNSITSSAIITTTNGDLIYGSTVNLVSNGTQSVGTGFTQAQLTANSFLTEFLTQATAASIAATMTPTSALDGWITYVMAFKAAPAGGPVAHLRLLENVGQ